MVPVRAPRAAGVKVRPMVQLVVGASDPGQLLDATEKLPVVVGSASGTERALTFVREMDFTVDGVPTPTEPKSSGDGAKTHRAI